MSEGHGPLLLKSLLWFSVAFKMSRLGIRASHGICLTFHSPARIPRTSSRSHAGPLAILQPCILSHHRALLVPLPMHLCVTTCSSGVECLWARGAQAFPGQDVFSLLCSPVALCAKTCTHTTLFRDCLFLCPSPSVACELLGGRTHVLLISDPPRLAQCLAQSTSPMIACGVHEEGATAGALGPGAVWRSSVGPSGMCVHEGGRLRQRAHCPAPPAPPTSGSGK